MTPTPRTALPVPSLSRWQPLRLGLVELFHYDSEEFWFRDGHLLLRGNNGTGKSKVLSLSLPFLFDAQLKSSRIEPDGDSTKKMAWNLLMGKHDRRIGYTWLEFGRLDGDGQPRYLTLGCGLSAHAARAQVDSWFFLLHGRRVGQDLWLMNPARVVLTREHLREALGDDGQVFETATAYRRAVDEHLFQLGAGRYAALMDTLIQLRQPQLSRKPDERSLSDALTEALPPLSDELLGDVADALNRLEEYRRELEEYESLFRTVGQFNQRYGRYAATQSRRHARSLRSAQTGFDQASRTLNEQRLALASSRQEEEQASQALQQALDALGTARLRLDALLNDPGMADARSLDRARDDARQRRQDHERAVQQHQQRCQRHETEQQRLHEALRLGEEARSALKARQHETRLSSDATGLRREFDNNPLSREETLLGPEAAAGAARQLENAASLRREHIGLIEKRWRETEDARHAQQRAQTHHDQCADEFMGATEARDQADAAIESECVALIEAWQSYLLQLRQLKVADTDDTLNALSAWAPRIQGENPARQALLAALQGFQQAHARRQMAIENQLALLQQDEGKLLEERQALQEGEQLPPPRAPWRQTAPVAQSADPVGAPLWQLIDFHPDVPDTARAGLEAALQASGLLDAWVLPDGRLMDAAQTSLLSDELQWTIRPVQPTSLADWLHPVSNVTDSGTNTSTIVPANVVERLLQGVHCAEQDDPAREAWLSPTGAFRLGALSGQWQKAQAQFIGYAAREASRQRRLHDINEALRQIGQQRTELEKAGVELATRQQQASDEWQQAPEDGALREAHLQALAASRFHEQARQRLTLATENLQTALSRLAQCREQLETDAADLKLPATLTGLRDSETALRAFIDHVQTLLLAAHQHHARQEDHQRQAQREAQTRLDVEEATEHRLSRQQLAEQAAIQLATLEECLGAQVEELQRQLAQARQAVTRQEQAERQHQQSLRQAAEQRARLEQLHETAESLLAERTRERQEAIGQWQRFAATGLLAMALPEADQPSQASPWTIEPALSLARRTEQALSDIRDDDDAWRRIQNQVSVDYTELQRGLAALGQQAQSETTDFGMVVSIIYQNRPERPDQLATRLAGEIALRRETLTASEREILENHLQAEIASTIQRLLREAEHQVQAINDELDKRRTSTGVRFRLQWETLPEGEDEGAPVGLKAARQRLLNTSADLWGAEDRQVVGEMLQGRIMAERNRGDDTPGISLQAQLARALDYRRWHRFRVQRWDGQWRPLSGPASSGERALGVTVPLFAAVSSFYSRADYPHAPRLVLLDEVFAGIDDAARQHCWALIREFDLDFVITSEREWACSAELPGVSIAQLQRHEHIDAVHVSRWTWDGLSRRREEDPDRRFPPQPGNHDATIDDTLMPS